MAERARIAVAGVVQGVGFRPFVHALATGLGVRGFITNTADGVLIEAEGIRLAEFLDRLRTDAPPLARITGLSVEDLPFFGYPDFSIRKSVDSPRAFTLVSPDVSLCADCRRELLDPADRRFRYPFINCTNCGPRYSITRSVPYDRPNTTMAVFAMCRDCSREYHDPRDRRFHAQPNACSKCGPQVQFRVQSTKYKVQGTPIEQCIALLKQGGIAAIKGLGGFHIACDAANHEAVSTLRQRKRKSNKPFAVMAPDVACLRSFCEVSDSEEKLLLSHQRPIVLLRKSRQPLHSLSGGVSPGNRYIGCMLPSTPLHELLFQEEGASFRALVMTSGNLSEEPIVRDNHEAIEKLSGLADAFLLHDRDIFMRVDDSVVRATSDEGQPTRGSDEGSENGPSLVTRRSSQIFLRRSRGYAPDPIALQRDGPEVLGCGADLKNTFTLTKGTWAIPSQHIGDMENYETLRFYEECLANLKQVYRTEPVAVVHDLHPGYLSTRWAKEQGVRGQGPGIDRETAIYAVQHHYAHIGSVMAEHGLEGPVIGVAFDGTGYGTDGKLWGGEFLLAGIDGFERIGQFKDVPLPGGEAAIREPWRTAASYCREATGEGVFGLLERLGFVERHGSAEVRLVLQVAGSEELSPRSSGAGRLFDAVSALMGLCSRNTFEGEAAMALESCVVDGVQDEYPVELHEKDGYTVVDFSRLIKAVADDILAGRDRGTIATRFHNTLVSVILQVVRQVREHRGIDQVALSGGTFQNEYLLFRTVDRLQEEGMQVFFNRQMPPNDACISLGQAYIVRERLKKCGMR